MSAADVEVVRRALNAFAETGEADLSLFSEDLEIYDHDLPDSPVHHGHAGLARWTANWAGVWDDWSIKPEEFIDAGDRVVAVVRNTATGRGSGVTLDRRDAAVYTVRGGQIVRLDWFNNVAQALEAAGVAG